MRISTRGEYGVRAMLDLALRYGEGPIALKLIAERQEISEHYLEQLMGALRKSGLVTSVRGAQGGYHLSAPPAEMQVIHVIEALEGPVHPQMDEPPPPAGGRDQIARFGTRALWQEIGDRVTEVLSSTSLEDLCTKGAEMQARDSSYVYHI